MFDSSEYAICGDQKQQQQYQDDRQPPKQLSSITEEERNGSRGEQDANDPLDQFRNAASIMGISISPLHSRFDATLPTSIYLV